MLANDYASDCKDSQYELWHRISKDEYMAYAVKECYYSAERILNSLVDAEGQRWYVFLRKDETSDAKINFIRWLPYLMS
jgi:callose synthase